MTAHAERRCARHEGGQSTLEYAVVLLAVSAVLAAGAALWRFVDAGTLVEHAALSASHHLQGVSVGNLADVFCY